MRSFRKEGQDYLLFSVAEYQKKPKKPYERKCLTINVDTDEIKVWDDIKDFRELLEDSEEAQKYRNQLSIFQEWSQEKESGENQLLAANGFTYLSMETDMAKSGKKIFCTPLSLSGYKTSGVVELRIATDSLPEKNDALYQKFPGLEAYRGKKDLVVKIFLGNFPTSEEIFRLVIEDGQEISFEGCVMDGKYSKDGQMHEIGSFAEFEEWYQDPQK